MFLNQPTISRTKRDIKVRYRRKKWASEPSSDPDDDLESRFEISWVTLIEREETGREVESEEIVVKGNVAEGVLHPGLEYRLFGKWEDRPPHGWSFAYESFVIDKPATREAVCQYLRACKGIGSVRAGRLFDKYGESSIDLLMTYPAKVAQEVSGLKVEDCEAAAELLKKSEHIRKSKLELIGVLTGKGFPRTLTDLILRDYGADAAEAVRRNPYLLMRYRSVGFLKTDKLYERLRAHRKAVREVLVKHLVAMSDELEQFEMTAHSAIASGRVQDISDALTECMKSPDPYRISNLYQHIRKLTEF